MKLRQALVYLTIFLLLILSFTSNVSASSQAFYWSPYVAFKLSAYNTVIRFADWVYFDKFAWDSFVSSSITFYNLRLEGETNVARSFFISVQNANITITQLLENSEFHATLYSQSGALATLIVSCSRYNYMPTQIIVGVTSLNYPLNSIADFDAKNEDCWYYDAETNKIYIKATSPVDIVINWGAPSGGAPSGRPTQPSTSVPTTTPATDTVTSFLRSIIAYFRQRPLLLVVIIILVAIILIIRKGEK